MPQYKVDVLRDDDQVISRVNLFCGGVERAKEWAKALVDCEPVELWDGSTRIARFEPWHGPHANRSAPAGEKRTLSAALIHRQPAALNGYPAPSPELGAEAMKRGVDSFGDQRRKIDRRATPENAIAIRAG